MKKIALILSMVFYFTSDANIIVVTVQNFQFSPVSFTANVGDIIRWTWAGGVNGGTHTTTSGTIPPGAAPWDSPINSTTTQYDYLITISGAYNYVCSFHAAFGMTASFTVNAAAPVKLGTLTAKAGGNGKPMLSWETFTEDNADFFSVQRSENGKAFQEIGRVKAAGNSTSSRKYGFIDATVDQRFRYFYYQLLVVDLDKKEERSRIILYRQETQKKNIIVSLSPNPVQAGDHLQLWFNADERTKMQATIYEATGRQVYKDELSAYTGVNFAHLHIHDLPAGVYLLKLSIGKLKETRTFTVQ